MYYCTESCPPLSDAIKAIHNMRMVEKEVYRYPHNFLKRNRKPPQVKTGVHNPHNFVKPDREPLMYPSFNFRGLSAPFLKVTGVTYTSFEWLMVMTVDMFVYRVLAKYNRHYMIDVRSTI
jgi:hypothetical protein